MREELKNNMSVDESSSMLFKRVKPYAAVILLQFGYAGMTILAKFALNKGLNHYILVVYRHAIATAVIAPFALILERNRPRMTFAIFAKIMLLALLEPVIDQNMYYSGMKYTTATFTAAMCNVVPAFTFIFALAVRLEKVNIKRLHSQAKVVGTIVTVGGAMLMTLLKGPGIGMGNHHHDSHQTSITSTSTSTSDAVTKQDPLKGALMITAGCTCWACFTILQAITLRSYPAELSLTALICMAGMVEGGTVALIMERGNAAVWAIHFDSKFFAALYSGIICSGVAYYVQGMIMKDKGPVFVSAFNPLSMIIVAVAGSIFLGEEMFLGRLMGAIVIVIGLYLVIWGKSKDQKRPSSSDHQVLPIDQPMSTIINRCSNHNNNNVVDGSHRGTRIVPTDEAV